MSIVDSSKRKDGLVQNRPMPQLAIRLQPVEFPGIHMLGSFGNRVNGVAHLGQGLDFSRARQVSQPSDPKRWRPANGRSLHETIGKLICEVPKCGFDFAKRYGRIGIGYVQVHHLRPLSSAPAKGMSKKPSDLAIVCANCHAMIHRGGECRKLKSLIP